MCFAGFAAAEEASPDPDKPGRVILGTARMFSNDALGDGRDRWRTGSTHFSLFRGAEGAGIPNRPGAILEYRFRTEVVTAENVGFPSLRDRRHAGIVELGIAAPFASSTWEGTVGGSAVLVGPKTGLGEVQATLHEIVGLPEPDLTNQLGNDTFLIGRAEVARRFDMPRGALRPYAGVQLGFETFARAGVDYMLGARAADRLLTRDYATGTLLSADRTDKTGLTLLMGADVAYIADSALLPEDTGPAHTDTRVRARAGVALDRERFDVFYGLTYLGEEFEGQQGGQVLGSIRLSLDF
ncbi:MAG: lipid A-modifier LpxR family protein [Shimia sp.]